MTFDIPLDPMIRLLLAAMRAGMVLLMLPVAGGEGAPAPMRVVLSLLLGGLLAGFPDGELPRGVADLALSSGREIVIGLAIGFVVRVLLAAPALAGDMIAQEIGLKMAEDVDPMTRVPSTAPSRIYETALLLLFLVSNGHHDVIRALHGSFAAFPVGGRDLPPGLPGIVTSLSSCMRLSVMIAAPLMAVLMVGSLSLALLARAVPDLHVMTFGYPLRLLATLFAALTLFPFVHSPGLRLIGVLRMSLLRLVGA